MRVGKYYFMAGELVKVLQASLSFNELLIYNYDQYKEQVLDLHGANIVAKPAFKIGDVAKLLNKSPDTIRKWEVRGWIEPQRQWKLSEKKSIRFYTAEDIEAMRDVVQYIHVGRPRKDRRITSTIPDKGNLKRYIRERMKHFNV